MADLQTKFRLFREISSRTDLTPSAHKVFSVLLITHHNLTTGRCDPSISMLVKSTGLGRATVLRALADLRAGGIVDCESAGGGTTKNSYSFPALSKSGGNEPELPLPVSNRDRSKNETGINPRPVSENDATGLKLRREPVSNRDPNKESNREKHTRRAEARARVREDFARFWAAWPNRIGRKAAEQAFRKVAGEIEAILAGVERYQRFVRLKPPDRQAWLNPATFLNGERWKDELTPGAKPAASPSPGDPIIEFPGGYKRKTSFVRNAVAVFATQPRKWPFELGPPPGMIGCCVPKELLDPAVATA